MGGCCWRGWVTRIWVERLYIGGHGWGEHEVGRLGAVGVCWSSACMGVWCEWREARRVRGRGRSSPFVYLVV